MKKLLLLFLLLSACVVRVNSQITDIMGNQDVFPNETWLYSLYFNNLSEDTQFVLSTSKFGTFKGSSDTTKIVKINKGTTRYDFWVTWGGTFTNNALITAYKVASATKKTLKIKILDPNPDVQISGPSSIVKGNNGAYKLVPDRNYNTPTWRTNSSAIRIISDANAKSVTVRAEQGTGTAILYVDMKNSIGKVLQTLSKTITLTPRLDEVVSSKLLGCPGELVTYELPESNGLSIVWEAIANAALISGQGTSAATFKISGNGFVKVKAIVKYDAKEYIVENSKVWVGIPEFENPYDAVTLNVEKGMPYVCQFNVPGNAQGENTYTWSIKGPATITRTDNKTGSVNFLVNANARGLISLTGSVQNRCGKCLKDQWIEAFLGNGGGILKSIPQSISEDKPQQTSSPQSVKIYSFATGYLLYQEKNVTNFNIQNTNLNPDIYILEITDSEGNTTRQKVAKNNY